jgi:hypothetical protein
MTVGTRATQATPIEAHATTSALPYEPRRLTRGERGRREIFVYFSVRNQRIVTVADTVNVAMALQLEFDVSLTHFVERPRRLQLGDKQQIDISFWTRSKTGEERFWLVIPDSGTVGSTSGTLAIRDRSVLDAAAERQGLILHYVTEEQLLGSRLWLATAFELLPLVWLHQRLVNRSLIRMRIEEQLRQVERMSLSGLIKALAHEPTYEPTRVRAVVAAMIHQGRLRLVDYQPGASDAVLEVVHA